MNFRNESENRNVLNYLHKRKLIAFNKFIFVRRAGNEFIRFLITQAVRWITRFGLR